MKLNPNDLNPTLKRLNPHLFVGGVEKPLSKQNLKGALDRIKPRRKAGKTRLVVGLVRYGRRKLDDDNLSGGFKGLRDAIAASIGIDDGDSRLRWEYGQIETQGQCGTMITIELQD